MSALGHKRTWRQVRAMSAFPPKADIPCREQHVRFVPIGALLSPAIPAEEPFCCSGA